MALLACVALGCGSQNGTGGGSRAGETLDEVDVDPPPDPAAPSSSAPGSENETGSGKATLTVTLTGAADANVTSTPAGLTCSGTTCAGNFPIGTTVTLATSPASGAVFTGWSGACTGATCTPTLTANVAVVAGFQMLGGSWTGTYKNVRDAFGCQFTNSGTLTASVNASGTMFSTAATSITGLQLRDTGTCRVVGSTTGTSRASALTVAATQITGTWNVNVASGGTLAFPFTAKATGRTLTGTWTCATCTGGFTLTMQ